MKLKFKVQDYQTRAVESVVDCFSGQPNQTGIQYRIDPGAVKANQSQRTDYIEEGFRNAPIQLSQ